MAGVTIDLITGITSDATAANSPGGTNWGRVRVYGRHADVSWDTNMTVCTAGSKVGTHTVAGTANIFLTVSDDIINAKHQNVSRDHFGVTTEACAAANETIDIFLTRG